MCTQRGLESQVELGVHAKEGEELDVYGEGSCNSYNALTSPPTLLPSLKSAPSSAQGFSAKGSPGALASTAARNMHHHWLVCLPSPKEADGAKEEAKQQNSNSDSHLECLHPGEPWLLDSRLHQHCCDAIA